MSQLAYNPERKISGWQYYSIGQIFSVLENRCDREYVRALCSNALARSPSGLELRNEYLLKIRVGLQEWKEGITLAAMIKTLLTVLLDDTVEGGLFDYRMLNLDTVVAYDPSKLLEARIF